MSSSNGDYAEAFESCIRTIEEAASGKEAGVFRNMTREAANVAHASGMSMDEAIDRLWQAAETTGLTQRYGEDAVQSWLSAASSPPEKSATAEPGLEVLCLADVRAKPIEWLWENWIAIGKVSILAGDGGKGKSTVLCDLAARTTRGSPWPDGAPANSSGSVIILAAEDDVADTLAPRLLAAGADMRRVFNIRSVRTDDLSRRSFNLQADLERLEREIQTRGDVRLVEIDPISSYLGKGIDSHKNSEVRSVLEPLGEMAARMGVAVVCNNHFSKNGGNANARIIGSVAFVNQARAAFIVTPDAEDKTRLLLMPSKMNNAPIKHGLAYRIGTSTVIDRGVQISTSRICWESEPVLISADQALAAHEATDQTKTSKKEAIDFLRNAFGNEARLAHEVKIEARNAGITEKSLRSAREALGVKLTKAGMAGGWLWHPPKVPIEPEDAHVPSRATSPNEGTFGKVSAT